MGKWLYFCSWLTLAPDLSRVSDPIPNLHMFSDCVHVEILVENGFIIKKRAVEGYLRDVVHIFTGVGSDNPCLNVLGKIEFCLSRQLRA